MNFYAFLTNLMKIKSDLDTFTIKLLVSLCIYNQCVDEKSRLVVLGSGTIGK